MSTAYIESPLGFVVIKEEDHAVSGIDFSEVRPELNEDSELLNQVKNQLTAYFEGNLRQFDFPIKQAGTAFQQEVWNTLSLLRYAEVISYTQLANKMNNLLAIRAIAAANGKNKLMIVIPCHRVVGIAGEMTGYVGGIWRKKWLLEHEAKIAGIGQSKMFF
jgi:methylated-DNA-[protein]-cysteine S-methyltransferase